MGEKTSSAKNLRKQIKIHLRICHSHDACRANVILFTI